LRPISVSTMTAPILPANKKLRTKTLWWAALLVVLGIIGFWSLVGYFDELTALQKTDPQLIAEKYSRLLFFFGLATMLIASGAGGTLGFIFYKAWSAEQFPPPGIRLMWDTQLHTGKAARRFALAGLAAAVAIALGGLGFGTVMVKIACTLASSGPLLEAWGVSEGART
jgi:hypothetical protein